MNQEEFNENLRKEIQDIIDKVYTRSIFLEEKIKSNNENSMLITSEFTFALLFAIDLLLFENLGSEFRNGIIDIIVPNVLRGYINHFITDKSISMELYEKLENAYNQRLLVYPKCELNVKGIPGKGSVAFAMSYYMHQQKYKKPLEKEIDILTGVGHINSNDMKSLPNIEDVMKNHFELMASLTEYEFHKNINNLKIILSV